MPWICCDYSNWFVDAAIGVRNVSWPRIADSYRSLLPSDISSSLLEFGSRPKIIEPDEQNENQPRGEVMKEPFTYLRPCNTFKELGWRSELISSKDILEDLGKKMEI